MGIAPSCCASHSLGSDAIGSVPLQGPSDVIAGQHMGATITEKVTTADLKRIQEFGDKTVAESGDEIHVTHLEWIDWLVRQLWPNMEACIQKIVKEKVEPQMEVQLRKKLGAFASHFEGHDGDKRLCKFKTVNLGKHVPKVGPIHAYRKNTRDAAGIECDCGIELDCHPTIELEICGVMLGVKRLKFAGVASAVMTPLVDSIPVVGGIQAFLLNRPTLEFELSGHLEMLNGLSVIKTTMAEVILDNVGKALVLPNRIHINLIKDFRLDLDVVSLSHPLPEMIVRVHVKRARNLPGADYQLTDVKNFFTKQHQDKQHSGGSTSDPFCKVTLGNQVLRTETMQKTLDPDWPITAVGDFFVHSDKQHLTFEVFDDDYGYSGNDLLGSVTQDLFTAGSSSSHTLKLDTSDGDGKFEVEDLDPAPTLDYELQWFIPTTPVAQDFRRASGRRTSHNDAIGQNSLGAQALLSVKIYGIRPMGAATQISDAEGMVARVTCGATTQLSKKARLRRQHMEFEGITPQVLKIVRNLRTLHPSLTDDQIAEAAEVEPSIVKSVLAMNEMCPVQMDAGFFFLAEDVNDGEVEVQFLEPKKENQKPRAVVSQKFQLSELLDENVAPGFVKKQTVVMTQRMFKSSATTSCLTENGKDVHGTRSAVLLGKQKSWSILSPFKRISASCHHDDSDSAQAEEGKSKEKESKEGPEYDIATNRTERKKFEIVMELRLYSLQQSDKPHFQQETSKSTRQDTPEKAGDEQQNGSGSTTMNNDAVSEIDETEK